MLLAPGASLKSAAEKGVLMRFISLIAIAFLAGCSGKSEDPTKSLQGRKLSASEREHFDLDGLKIGQSRQAAMAKIAKQFPNYRLDSRGDWVVYAYGPDDDLSVFFDEESPTHEVVKLERTREFPNGAKKPQLLSLFESKFGKLVEPEPVTVDIVGEGKQVKKPAGIYFAGEGVTEDGILLKRCIGSTTFDFHNFPPADCGIMARVVISTEGNVATRATVTLQDFQFSHDAEVRAKERRKQQQNAEAAKAERDATEVTSF